MTLSLEIEVESMRTGNNYYRVIEGADDDGRCLFNVRYVKGGGLDDPYTPNQHDVTWQITGPRAEELKAKALAVKIQVCPDFTMGLDGGTTTVRIEQGFNRVELRWWVSLPHQWQDVRGLLAHVYASRPGSEGDPT